MIVVLSLALGWHEPVSHRHHITTVETAYAPAAIPTNWDWRSVNGSNWLGKQRGSKCKPWHLLTRSSSTQQRSKQWHVLTFWLFSLTGPIRNHHSPGRCASCWTFASTSSLSDRECECRCTQANNLTCHHLAVSQLLRPSHAHAAYTHGLRHG